MQLINKEYLIEHYYLNDDGIFPNSHLPVIVYKSVLNIPFTFPAFTIKKLFKSHNWANTWDDGVFDYHHYHSNTHEALGIYKGKSKLLFGGDKGVEVTLQKGDVVIIPAGVAHKNLNSKNSLKCVGAYPDGKSFDMNYGKPFERPQTDKNILKVKLPVKDPVFGLDGGRFLEINESL